jgi:DNA-binding NarL/FixJ family response regulator
MIPYRIVLANNHAPLREALKRILKEKSDLEVIGEAEDGSALLNLLSSTGLAPNMVILDPSMENFQGIEAIHKVKAIYPDVKVLILSMHRDKEYLSQAISGGAEGYLIKETVGNELLTAIETIMQGRLYVPPFP